jgi:hypothetical protein
MAKRRKGQSLDFYVGILKSIGQNKDGLNDRQLSVMLAAADRLAVVDDLPRLTQADSGQPAIPVTTDALLQTLREKHSGGTA